MRNAFAICVLLLTLPIVSCTQPTLLDADAGEDMTVAPEEAITLSATASGGQTPYIYRWNVEVLPEDGELDLDGGEMGATIDVGPLNTAGRYVFRVRVTDAVGATDASFVTVQVGGDLAVSATARDRLRTVGESTPVDLVVDADSTGLSNRQITWEVISGDATISDPSSPNPDVTINSEDTVRLRVTLTADDNGEQKTGIAAVAIVGVRDATPQVVITNSGAVNGDVVLELYADDAPATVANFLRYVDSGFYDGLLWHRVDRDFVIQTGAYERVDGELVRRSGVRPAIDSEADNGRSNVEYAVGMSLEGDDADSARTQFYVNVADNPGLDDGDPPYTVFGRVVDGEAFVDAIAAVEVHAADNGLDEVPVDDIIMQSIRRIETEVPTDSDTNGPVIDIEVSVEPDDDLLVIGESTRVRTTVVDPPEGLRYSWEALTGEVSFSSSIAASPVVTAESAETIHLRVTVRGDGVRTATADTYIVGVASATPRVIIENDGGVDGEIVLELLTEAAPSTCANFLRYVDDRFYDGIVWHRVVSDFVIQAGAFERVGDTLVQREGVRAPVESEAGNGQSNLRSYVSMALRGTDADSGTNQFFINIDDNAELDDGSPPFTVFAQVVEGMDVADEIAQAPNGNDSGLENVPATDIVMTRVRRASETTGGDIATITAAGTNDLTGRMYHAASAIANRDNPLIMVSGGLAVGGDGTLLSLADVSFYDANSNAFVDAYTSDDGALITTPTLNVARSGHTQTQLQNGRVVVIGGRTGAAGTDPGTPTNVVELFDPDTGVFTIVEPMPQARAEHTATRMPVVRIVVAGGETFEAYDPNGNGWFGPHDMIHERSGHAAVRVNNVTNVPNSPTTIPDHRALVIAGEGTGPTTMEFLKPDDGTAELLSSRLPLELRDLAAVNFNEEDNLILIAGGRDLATGNTVDDAFILDAENDVLRAVDPLPDRAAGIARHQMILLDDRYVVVVGGEEEQDEVVTPLDYYAVFDTETETWLESGLTRFARRNFAAADINTNSVLIVGGGEITDPLSPPRGDAEVMTLDLP